MSAGRELAPGPGPAGAASGAALVWNSVRGYPLTAFVICLVGVSLENMDQAFFAFVLPQISKELGWSVVERGLYLTVTSRSPASRSPRSGC